MNRGKLTDDLAYSHSVEMVESGYLDWLLNNLRESAVNIFRSSSAPDALLKAKDLYDVVDLVEAAVQKNVQQGRRAEAKRHRDRPDA